MYTMEDIGIDMTLKKKYQVHSYQQLERKLLEKIQSVQMIENSYARCELLLDLANVYLHMNKRLQALEHLEQADTLIIEYTHHEFLSGVYLLRAHLALLHNDWTIIHELCKFGITAASKFKQYDHIACFYLIWMQIAIIDGTYDKAILFGKLVLHFIAKHKGDIPICSMSVALFLLFAYNALQKNNEAHQLLTKLTAKKNLAEVSELYVNFAQNFYSWVNTKRVEQEAQLHEQLHCLWQLGQYTEVKTISSVMLKYHPVLYATRMIASAYAQKLELEEEMIQFLERFNYHDQIRAVQRANDGDEKIGYHTGKSYRKLLKEKIEAATDEQYITIMTFVIQVNNTDLLDRHVRVKYDYYTKIERDLAQFYPKSFKGKYYPSSFCVMFITDEPLNIQAISKRCQDYLDGVQLELEGQPIYYRIHTGASSVTKKALTSLQSLYQEADKSLYYAKVTKQTLLIYGKEG